MSAPRPIAAFYINLAPRTDRRAFMENQFSQLGISVERVEAATIADVPEHLALMHIESGIPYAISRGDLACGLSHQAIWRLMRDRSLPAALILEDDAVLTPDLLQFMDEDVLNRVEADLLKLETRRSRVLLGDVTSHSGELQLRELQSSHMGSAAYIISAAVAATSLADPQINDMGVDRFLFGTGGPHLLDRRILQVVPSPVLQLDRLRSPMQQQQTVAAQSDIVAGRKSRPERPKAPKLLRMLALKARHAGRLLRLAARDPGVIGRRRRPVPFVGDQPTTEVIS